jgi:hypothetical protein
MALTTALFDEARALYWRVDFKVRKMNRFLNVTLTTGLASLYLVVNLLPKNGTCSVNTHTGLSLATWFQIKCVNWLDLDGYVANYQFFGKKKQFLNQNFCIFYSKF